MLIAKQKRKENIAEYILYMFQVEDLIRAFKLDTDLIKEKLVPNYNADEKTSGEIFEWYTNLLSIIKKEGIQKNGHMQFLKNLINELNEFHLKVLEIETEKTYSQTFQTIAGLITELKQKNQTTPNDIEMSLSAIYGFLLLKMQKKEISAETTEAIERLSGWLRMLSALFAKYESGDFEI